MDRVLSVATDFTCAKAEEAFNANTCNAKRNLLLSQAGPTTTNALTKNNKGFVGGGRRLRMPLFSAAITALANMVVEPP